MNLKETGLIDDDFVPVYGTELDLTSFKQAPGAVRKAGKLLEASHVFIVDAVNSEKESVRYILWPSEPQPSNSTTWYCAGTRNLQTPLTDIEIDDWDIQLTNPYTSVRGGKSPLYDWVSAIMLEDAAGNQQPSSKGWDDEGLDAAMERAELNIVAYNEEAIAPRSFETIAQLQEWVDDALSDTQVKVQVLPLKELPALMGDEGKYMELLRHMHDGEDVRYRTVAVSTDWDGEEWISGRLFGLSAHDDIVPVAAVNMSGPAIISSDGKDVLNWESLKKNEKAIFGDVDGALADYQYLLLHMLGTDMVLPMPVEAAHLIIETDNDGASVQVRVIEAKWQTRMNRLKDDFERRWGRWLDDEVTLSEAELLAGQEQFEMEILATIAREKEAADGK